MKNRIRKPQPLSPQEAAEYCARFDLNCVVDMRRMLIFMVGYCAADKNITFFDALDEALKMEGGKKEKAQS